MGCVEMSKSLCSGDRNSGSKSTDDLVSKLIHRHQLVGVFFGTRLKGDVRRIESARALVSCSIFANHFIKSTVSTPRVWNLSRSRRRRLIARWSLSILFLADFASLTSIFSASFWILSQAMFRSLRSCACLLHQSSRSSSRARLHGRPSISIASHIVLRAEGEFGGSEERIRLRALVRWLGRRSSVEAMRRWMLMARRARNKQTKRNKRKKVASTGEASQTMPVWCTDDEECRRQAAGG
jgi:hypothetical protein